MDNISLGLKIRQLREQKRLTQMQLTEMIDITDILRKIEDKWITLSLENFYLIKPNREPNLLKNLADKFGFFVPECEKC